MKKIMIILFLFAIAVDLSLANESEGLLVLRKMYYQAADDESVIAEALKLQAALKIIYPEKIGLFMVYEGAFYALAAKHTFWPNNKLKFVNEGLRIMDEGLAISPEEPESLFIHGTICDNLPFFMDRGNDAQTDFKKLIKILPSHAEKIDEDFLKNIITYLIEHVELESSDAMVLATYVKSKKSGKL